MVVSGRGDGCRLGWRVYGQVVTAVQRRNTLVSCRVCHIIWTLLSLHHRLQVVLLLFMLVYIIAQIFLLELQHSMTVKTLPRSCKDRLEKLEKI